MTTIYHGSPFVVSEPDIRRSKPNNDYGPGFYCTEDIELAKEWACSAEHSGFVNQYEIDASSLKILNLNSDDYSPLHWLALLLQNRTIRVRTPLQRQTIDWLIEKYSIDIKKYDVVVGYRADDSYFAIVRAFVMNTISYEQLAHALRLGNPGDQFVLKSKKSFERIRYVESISVDGKTYYPKRKKRDDEARAKFLSMMDEIDANGVFIRDLMNNGG